METTVIKNHFKNLVLCLASGFVLVACGGADSANSSVGQAKLLANGEACSPAWAGTNVYVGGNKVSYNGVNYTANWWTQGNNPSTSSGPAGSGQPWAVGFTCGGNVTTTTTQTTTTTTKAVTTTNVVTTTTTTGSSCNYVNWATGQNYAVGTVVKYLPNGNFYREVNAGTNGSDGTDPTISTWYWSPTTCSGGTTTTTPTTTSTTISASGAVCFYQDINFQGSSYCVNEVTANAPSGWNDFASSVKVRSGYQVDLFADGGQQGASLRLTSDEANLVNRGFNDLMSSYKVGKVTQGSSLKIVGYTPSWSTVESTIQYNKLTHINYAFVLPNADGSLQAVPNPALLQTIVSNAHANGVKVVVSVGGWNDGNDSAFVSLASSSGGRSNFVNRVVSLVSSYNLDGIDIDWEFPDPGMESDNYSLLMGQLSTAMHTRGKILTAAVVGEGNTGGGVKNDVFGYVDFLNLMAYDANNGNHSSYAYAVQSLNYWSGRGLPAAKTVLGVPYYARPSWAAYNSKVSQNLANACRDTDGGDYWNGIPTMRSKATLARSYGGIMTWELSQDTGNGTSLLTAMWEGITGAAASYRCN